MMKKLMMVGGAALALAFAGVSSASAATTWTDWTSGVTGYPGSATGTMGGVNVYYIGENQCLNCYASNWSPGSTWTGGPVSNAPPGNSGIQLIGGGGQGAIINTLTFSSAVVNPILAIVSLGQGGIDASFNFFGNPTLQVLGGGGSDAWGGVPLTLSGSNVSGVEGNGLVEFVGTFSSISWTNPVAEDYYAFTVGSVGEVPEPATWAMMVVGLGGLGMALRSRRRSVAATA